MYTHLNVQPLQSKLKYLTYLTTIGLITMEVGTDNHVPSV